MATLHTVSLTRARTVGRQSRAQKAVKILKEELEHREKEDVLISKEVNQKIWERGAEKPPSTIQVEIQTTSEGKKRAELVQTREEEAPTQSQTTEEETSREETEKEAEIDVSGTVKEVKEEIREKEDQLDLEEVLEKEKENKDRKTLKQFIKGLMD